MAKARADDIHDLRERKGWSQEMLAKKAGIDPKTMSNLLNGGECRLSTIALIAEALGVEPGCLILGNEPDPPLGTPPWEAHGARVKVVLKLNLEFASFDELRFVEEMLPRLREAVGMKHDIDVIAVGRGSVHVTLSMDPEDARYLIAAYLRNYLDEFSVDSITILGQHFEIPDQLPPTIDSIARAEWTARRNAHFEPQLPPDAERDAQNMRPDRDEVDEQ